MQQLSAPLFPLEYHRLWEKLALEHIIEDRGSYYTISVYPFSDINALEIIRTWFDASATHNSYAWKLLQDDGRIFYDSNDDGETWAGQIILREIERFQMVDVVLVVTRYFWGVKLEGDRYKHIVDGCRMGLNHVM
jgi:putative IMPACT (imprinted ancient) family translation regulator